MIKPKNQAVYIVGLFLTTLMIVTIVHNWLKTTEQQGLTQQIEQNTYVPVEQALGINLNTLNYYSTQWVFVDVAKQGSEWIILDSNGNRVRVAAEDKKYIPVDESGYPLEVPFVSPDGTPQRVRMITCDSSYPSGDYLVLFDGEGEIRIWGRDLTYRQESPGRYIVTLGGKHERINIDINKSTLGNHIRNLRVIMPGFHDNYEEQVFHPLFLERLQGFKVIRMVNLMKANGNQIVKWEDRTKPNDYTQAKESFGIAPEYMAELVNRTEADIWINIPHQADDNYVKMLAELLYYRLDSNKKIYVEYSNELWNRLFPQTRWLYSVSCENPETFVAATSEGDNLKCNQQLASFNFHVKRIAEIADIFAEVFTKEFDDRIVITVASQSAVPWKAEKLLQLFSDPNLNPKGYQPDALAIAPYFGHSIRKSETEEILEKMTVEQILDRSEEQMVKGTFAKMREHKAIADDYNIPLVAYEGGQHLSLPMRYRQNKTLVEKMIAANRSPRMGDLHRKYYKYWFDEVKGGIFAHYAYVREPGQGGSWGALETQDQLITEAPKYEALLDIIKYLKEK